MLEKKFKRRNSKYFSHLAEFVISATVTANPDFSIDTLIKQEEQTNFILVILFI